MVATTSKTKRGRPRRAARRGPQRARGKKKGKKRFEGLVFLDAAPGSELPRSKEPAPALTLDFEISQRRVLRETKRLSSRFTPDWIRALEATGVRVCPACRGRNRATGRSCRSCGAELPRAKAAPTRAREVIVVGFEAPRQRASERLAVLLSTGLALCVGALLLTGLVS